MRPSGLIARGLVLAAGLVVCPSAFALNPSLEVSQYVHTAWRIRDGYIDGTTQAIAQTPDGYIWLGSNSGLFRFDGIRATRWQPPHGQELPSTNIINLLAAPNGALWIATAQGLGMWDGRTLTQYGELNGQYIGKLLADRDGTVWVTAADMITSRWTLCAVSGRTAHCDGRDGGAGVGAIGLFEDPESNLWVGTLGGLWRWKPQPSRFFSVPPTDNGVQGIVQADGGGLLLSLRGGLYRFAEGRAQLAYRFPASVLPPQAQHLLRDRHGNVWIGTASSGLVHLHNNQTDLFAEVDGLSGDRVLNLLEDREGNIWVVTRDGVDRFRDPAVATVSRRQGLPATVTSVAAATDGSVWIGTFAGLFLARGGEVRPFRTAGLPEGSVDSLFTDQQGRLWVTIGRLTGVLENGRFVRLVGVPEGTVRGIAEDSTGVWLASDRFGLIRVSQDGRQIHEVPPSVLGRQGAVTTITARPAQAGVWVGFVRGGVMYFQGETVRASFSASDGLAAGAVRSLRFDPDGALWVAAEHGLSWIRRGSVTTLTRQDGLPCDAIRWVAEDNVRSLWVQTTCGLVQILRPDLEARFGAAATGGAPARLRVGPALDIADGVRESGVTSFTSPVAKSVDGKLWFPAADGVSVLDPGRLPFNALPPPVQIEQITADHRRYDAPGRLPARVRDLQIDYTALSFVAPDKIRFRYRLDGYDADWQDVGNRRQAYYTNLPPRDYRFRVIASNNSGVWNETGATVSFVIAPAYYQTTWFLALSVGSVAVLVWAAHRVRLRIVEKHDREIIALNERLMKAQEQERTRIAGELHDGVMQEMLAATMMLGTAKRRIPDDVEGKATIEKVQQKLIQVGADLRQLSHELHPPMLQQAGLPEAVRAYCEEFTAGFGVPVLCAADEAVQDLSRGAALALFRILQEALGNAAKHAAATNITVRLTRADGTVSLVVSDDGVGFDRNRPGTFGGLGLITIRERAGQLHGTFEVESAPGRGTTITVVIPFRS